MSAPAEGPGEEAPPAGAASPTGGEGDAAPAPAHEGPPPGTDPGAQGGASPAPVVVGDPAPPAPARQAAPSGQAHDPAGAPPAPSEAGDGAAAGRIGQVVLVGALAVALSGFLAGMAQVGEVRSTGADAPGAIAPGDARHAPRPGAPTRGREDVAPAPRYRDIAPRAWGPNATFRTRLPAERPGTPGPSARSGEGRAGAGREGEDRALALLARAQRRAYDGAPPVIPHPVDPVSVLACNTCHEHGLAVGDVIAPRMPHAPYASCTQCHAPGAASELAAAAPGGAPARWSPAPEPAPLGQRNGFRGLEGAPRERVWPGAPPVIPHATWMRDDCLSCHGPLGHAPLRTSHPERVSCTQCHAPRASSP